MKYKFKFMILFVLLPGMVAAQEALNGYLGTAAENNPGLKAKFNAYMAALEVVPQAGALPDPQVAFAFFIQPVETRVGPQRLRISASQLFPWFGTLSARENAAVQLAKARYEEFEEARSALYNEVKSVYFDLYFNQRSMGITLGNMELLQSIGKMVTVKVESGIVSMVDDYRVQLEIRDLEDQLARLKDRQWVLERTFLNLLNVEEEMVIQLPEQLWETDFPWSREQALDSIQNSNPQILELEFRQASLAYRKEQAKRQGYPDLMVGLDYTFIGEGPDNLSGKDAFVFPSVGISVPLYRNKYRAMVREVAYLEAANAQVSENRKKSLEILFERSWKDYQDAERRIHLNDQQMELAEKALRLLESEYATANSNFEEILRMERRFLKYQLEFEKALADKQAAIAFIEFLMGK